MAGDGGDHLQRGLQRRPVLAAPRPVSGDARPHFRIAPLGARHIDFWTAMRRCQVFGMAAFA